MARTHISELATAADVNGNIPDVADPTTLCSNFRYGCNGLTDGPDAKGFLTLCDDCRNAEGYLLAGRGGITFEKS